MYTKTFEIRWSDIDANKHLANSAYMNFMSHTRTTFLKTQGFSLMTLSKAGVGPVVFNENINYFKESFLGEKITVSLEVSGLSEKGTFFKFKHHFYNDKGDHLASCEILGAWINLNTRKLAKLPESLLALSNKFPKTKDFKWLTKNDTRLAHPVNRVI